MSDGESKKGQVAIEMKNLRSQAEIVKKEFENMYQKITPIMSNRPVIADGTSVQAEPVLCDLALELKDITNLLRVLAEQIIETGNRIEL
jgi:hypothetical protein